MTIYRNVNKKNRPMICAQHEDTTYVTDKNWNLYMDKVEAGLIASTKKTIFFDTKQELEEFVEENTKVLMVKIK